MAAETICGETGNRIGEIQVDCSRKHVVKQETE